MRSSYEALTSPQKWLLISLLEGGYGCRKEKLRNLYEKHLGQIAGEPFGRLVEELSEGFLRIHHEDEWEFGGIKMKVHDSVSWIHPSYRDLVIEELANDTALKQQFLRSTNLEGIKLALSDTGGSGGGRKFPLTQADSDWKTLVDRCVQFAAGANESETTELLDVLHSAYGVASAEKASRISQAISSACEVLREKWSAAGPSNLEVLRAYCQASKVCDRLPALPRFNEVWGVLLSRLEEKVGSTHSTLFLFPEALDEWIELIDLLIANEPRFLAYVGFPERHTEVMANLFECIERELCEDVHEMTLSEVATNVRRIADRVRRLSALAGHEPGSVRTLIAQLHGHSDTLRDQARERDRENGEPPDDDDDDDRQIEYSNKDIETLFSDL